MSTIYGLSLQINSFFESFRSGNTPLGVSNFETYMEMQIAAPALTDSWAIAPAPGVRAENGEINRQYLGLGATDIIFSGSAHQAEAWELLKWWMSEDVQSEYALQMQTLYGSEYLYISANQDAFSHLSIDTADKQVILESWEQLTEPQFIPGWYMLERELSNIWNETVFYNGKPRDRIDEAIENCNKEIRRRMEEFGYLRDGKMVKPYPIYTVADIKSWAEQP